LFWGTQKLKERLREIVEGYAEGRVETSSYAMNLGSDVYVSPVADGSEALSKSVCNYSYGEYFAIPPGQFAYLHTEEFLKMPLDAIGLISIKSTFKWRGLVNVSGFHVDPGFVGQLRFAVFNAGPGPIHLRIGYPTFLIWFASLEGVSEPRDRLPIRGIDASQIIAGVVPSYESLRSRVDDLEGAHKYYNAIVAFTLSVAVLMLTVLVSGKLGGKQWASDSPNLHFTTSSSVASRSSLPP
jgi:dCTP deaminase